MDWHEKRDDKCTKYVVQRVSGAAQTSVYLDMVVAC